MRLLDSQYRSFSEIVAASTTRELNKWVSEFAQFDHASCRILLDRLTIAAQQRRLMPYPEFIKAVNFTLPDANHVGMPRRVTIDASVIRSEEESIIHDFGQYLGAATFRDCSVFINCLIVPHSRSTRPAKQFFDWARRIKVLKNHDYKSEDVFWEKAVEAVHQKYQSAA